MVIGLGRVQRDCTEMMLEHWAALVEIDIDEATTQNSGAVRTWANDHLVVAAHDEGWAIRLLIVTVRHLNADEIEIAPVKHFSFDKLKNIKHQSG